MRAMKTAPSIGKLVFRRASLLSFALLCACASSPAPTPDAPAGGDVKSTQTGPALQKLATLGWFDVAVCDAAAAESWAGDVGFRSYMSMWLGPPACQTRITDFSGVEAPASARFRKRCGRLSPPAVRLPTRRKLRRDTPF